MLAPAAGNREAVFVRIPKTASTSVEAILQRHDRVRMNSRDRILAGDIELWMHRGLANLWREALGDERWSAAYKFCFVRNPYDRAVSSWKHACRLLERGIRITADPGFVRTVRLAVDRVVCKATGHAVFGFSVSFGEFLALLEADRLCGQARWHCTPQSLHVADDTGRVELDFLGRFENLQVDFAQVCRVMGIECGDLPRLNLSRRDSYERYYDAPSRDIVRRVYSDDFELLGYRQRS